MQRPPISGRVIGTGARAARPVILSAAFRNNHFAERRILDLDLRHRGRCSHGQRLGEKAK